MRSGPTRLRYCCLVPWSLAFFFLLFSVFQGRWVTSKLIPFFFSLMFLFVLFLILFALLPLVLPSSLSGTFSQAAEPSWLAGNVSAVEMGATR